MQKKYIIGLICLSIILFSFSCAIPIVAASELHWYLKRHHGGTPGFPKEAELFSKYDAFYLDKSVTDDKKVIYLTFDAGYENGNIERILDTLKEEGVPSAFFLLDNIILKNTDLVNRMADEGHLICNHTKNHKNLSSASKDAICKDLCALENIYKEKTGREMSKYFRFPEGRYSLEALKCVKDMGYKTVFWSFAYDDWDNHKQPDPEKAIKKILDNTHNGAVMLFHPTSRTNADIFPRLIKAWREMGYSFGTLDDLTSTGNNNYKGALCPLFYAPTIYL